MNHAPSDSEVEELVLRVAVAIADRRDAFRPGEKLAQGYLDDARVAVEVMRGLAQQPDSGTSELRQLAVALRANTVKLRFFRGATYDGGADTYLTQLTQFIDAVMPMLDPAQQPRTEGPFKDGDPIVAALIWEVDRAVKQALRDGGKYETTIRWILNEHLRGFAQAPYGLAEDARAAAKQVAEWKARGPSTD